MQATCIEEEVQELCSLGMLPLEQRVKRKQRTWTDKASGTSRSEGPTGHVAVVSSAQPEDAFNKSWCYSPGMLFTFNGSWLLDDEEYLSVVKKWKAMSHILERCVKEMASVQSLFAEFSKLVQEIVQVYKCRKWTACLELSMKAEELGRLHFHCFLERNCKEDKAWAKWQRNAERMNFRGIGVSHSAPSAVKSRGRN